MWSFVLLFGVVVVILLFWTLRQSKVVYGSGAQDSCTQDNAPLTELKDQPSIRDQARLRMDIIIYVIVFAALSFGLYGLALYDAEDAHWLQQRDALLPDVQNFLDNQEASAALQSLPAREFVSLLSHYAQVNPDDSRIWQRLAVVSMTLEMPEQALKAVRRYMQSHPDDRQARLLEIQLLVELVSKDEGVSVRQLEFALEAFAQRDDLQPEDRVQLASLAQQFKLRTLEVSLWQSILAADQRPDAVLSSQALEGRRLIEQLIKKAQASADTDAVNPSSPQSPQSLPSLPSLTFQLELSAQAHHALQNYIDQQVAANQEAQYHLWVSARSGNGGPPLAAKLVWLENTYNWSQSLTVTLAQEDLVLPDRVWQLDDKIEVKVYLVLSSQQSDPATLAMTELQVQGSALVGQENEPVTLTIDQLKP